MQGNSNSMPPEEPPNWWRPHWTSAIGSVNWFWLSAVAGFALVTLLLIAGLFLPIETAFKLLFLKLIALFGGATVSLAIYIVKLAVKARREPFCIFCGYNLSGLPDNYRCPECGRDYTFRMIDEYRQDPAWFVSRWKMREKLPPSDAALDVPANAPRRISRDGT